MACFALVSVLFGFHARKRFLECCGICIRFRHSNHLLSVPVFPSRSIAQAITASLRAKATAALLLASLLLATDPLVDSFGPRVVEHAGQAHSPVSFLLMDYLAW